MCSLYVDRDPQSPKPHVVLTRTWSKLGASQAHSTSSSKLLKRKSVIHNPEMSGRALLVATQDELVELECVVLKALADLGGCRNDKQEPSLLGSGPSQPNLGELTFLHAIVMLTDTMLEFGLFQSNGKDDLKVIMGSVYNILDYTASHLENTRETRLHNETRLVALALLERMMDIRVNSRISTCVAKWEQICEEAAQAADADLDDKLLQTHARSLEDALFALNIVSPSHISADNYRPDQWRGGGGDMTTSLLLKLCHMKQPKIRDRALPLLMRHLTQKSALFSALREVELVAFPSAATAFVDMQIGVQKLTGVRKFLSDALDLAEHHVADAAR